MKTKFNNTLMMAAALIFAVALGSCDKKSDETPPPEEKELVEIEPIAVNVTELPKFGSKANETGIVSIGNTTEWEVRNEASWVIAEKQPDNTLRVRVTKSRNLLDRSATLTVVAANSAQGEASFVVTQAHGTPRLYTRQLAGGIPVRHVSENGLWATGQKSVNVVVVDINEIVDDSTYIGTQIMMAGGAHSIDNNGKPYENGCSADGTIYSGYDTRNAVDEGPDAEYFPAHYTPYIMRNNRKIELSYPSTYTTSNIEEPGYITRHMYQGCIPDKMSADGKYIYGRLMNTNMMWFAAKWTRIGSTNEYVFKELGRHSDGDLNSWKKVFFEHQGERFMSVQREQFLCAQNVSGLSINGKYACGHLVNSDMDDDDEYDDGMQNGGPLFRYDMEADRLELLDATGIALYVTDDGTLFDSNNKVYKLGAAAPITLNEWLTEIYGSTVAKDVLPGLAMGSVSADYSTTILFDVLSTFSCIITVEP